MREARNDGYQPVTLEAHDLVFGDREGSYGHPLDDFSCTAKMMTAYMERKGILMPGAELEAEDIGPFMNMVKLSRQANVKKRDNCTDGAGYWETTERVIFERARRQKEEAEFISGIASLRMARELDLRESDLKFPTLYEREDGTPTTDPGTAAEPNRVIPTGHTRCESDLKDSTQPPYIPCAAYTGKEGGPVHFAATPAERAQSFAAAVRAGGATVSADDEARFRVAAENQPCPCGDPDPTHALAATYRAESQGDKR